MPCSAVKFHDLGGAFLSDHGFTIKNNLEKRYGNYGSSKAHYANDIGLHIELIFEPSDGRYASIRCGRIVTTSKARYLSGEYSDLARRFGFDLQDVYPLGMEDKNKNEQDLLTIYRDLSESLPKVLEKCHFGDIEAIELAKRGALSFMQIELSFSGRATVDVSELKLSRSGNREHQG